MPMPRARGNVLPRFRPFPRDRTVPSGSQRVGGGSATISLAEATLQGGEFLVDLFLAGAARVLMRSRARRFGLSRAGSCLELCLVARQLARLDGGLLLWRR